VVLLFLLLVNAIDYAGMKRERIWKGRLRVEDEERRNRREERRSSDRECGRGVKVNLIGPELLSIFCLVIRSKRLGSA